MQRGRKIVIAGAAVAVAAVATTGIAVAGGVGGSDANEVAITGTALEQASAAALAHTGGGRVTDTEVGDEESLYEVEVTLDGGRQVDVQLDESFKVVGSASDSATDNDSTSG